ncbi:MAG: hypothetical protein ACN6PJ_27940, partial [Achromobacter sp.]|uniref:hypothetical protein n=1 Tax=Achromobacter sp. TaxID=134375 RepID=UPI003D049F0F
KQARHAVAPYALALTLGIVHSAGAHAEEERDKSGGDAEINPGYRGMGWDLSGWNCKGFTLFGRAI